MNALQRQNVSIPTEQNGVLVLYRSADRETAIHTGNRYRDEGRKVLLMRKDADTPLDVYKKYAAEHEVSTVVYIEDGKLTTTGL